MKNKEYISCIKSFLLVFDMPFIKVRKPQVKPPQRSEDFTNRDAVQATRKHVQTLASLITRDTAAALQTPVSSLCLSCTHGCTHCTSYCLDNTQSCYREKFLATLKTCDVLKMKVSVKSELQLLNTYAQWVRKLHVILRSMLK